MNCHEFADRLDAILDDRQSPQQDWSLVVHAQDCVNCRAALTGQEILFSGLDLYENPPLPRNFVDKVVAAALSEPNPQTEISIPSITLPSKVPGAVHVRFRARAIAAILATSACRRSYGDRAS